MVSLLVFDADDTLYPWLTFFVPSFFAMAEEVSRITGIDMNTLTNEYRHVHRQIGNSEYPYATLLLPSVAEWYGKNDREGLKQVLASAFLRFEETRNETLHLFPHVKETLDAIQNMGIPMVVYTDSAPENGVHRLKQLGIFPYFRRIYTRKRPYHTFSTDKNIILFEEPKPSKQNLLYICEKEGVAPNEVLFVGDSMAKDVYMAYMAGTKSALCDFPKANTPALYQKLVDISSWTETDFAQDKAQREIVKNMNIVPNYTLFCFDELTAVLTTENKNA